MNALLIGLGGIGMMYDLKESTTIQTHAKALFLRGFNVWAVDPEVAQRSLAESVYGFNTVSAVENLEQEILFDLIIIASPTPYHLSHAIWSLKQNAKVVLFEKPLVETSSELLELESAVANSSSQVMVNLIRNYDTTTCGLLSQFTTGSVIEVEYTKGLLHNGIHFLSLLIQLFGDVKDSRIVEAHSIEPSIDFHFENFGVRFHPSKQGDNCMRIEDRSLTMNFEHGGRTIHINEGGKRTLVLTEQLRTYQVPVLDKAISLMSSGTDDSFTIAVKAQKQIMSVLE